MTEPAIFYKMPALKLGWLAHASDRDFGQKHPGLVSILTTP